MFFQPKKLKKALFLVGGGARGAYQAGALKAIGEISGSKQLPVQILSAVSAGSINTGYLASRADDFVAATRDLATMWTQIHSDQIFKADNWSLLKATLRTLVGMIMHTKSEGGQYLLDATPLQHFVNANIDFKKINQNIDAHLISAFEVTSTCYERGGTVAFYRAEKPQQSWNKVRFSVEYTDIHSKHILASAGIPLFFPAIEINREHYGDGALRNTAPLRSSIYLGAEAVLIIGVRKSYPPQESVGKLHHEGISFAKILGSMLNALFLDNIDRDLETLQRINDNLDYLPNRHSKKLSWRKIETLYLRPSEDLAEYVAPNVGALPVLLRFLLKSFGSQDQWGDFVSYLLFESGYCGTLVDLGYKDTMAQQDAVQRFLEL